MGVRRVVAACGFVCVSLVSPGGAAAQSNEVVEYYGLDQVGSIRVVFDPQGAIKTRRDYAPFGEEVTTVTADPKVYAQLFRDDESKQDYAQARMYQPRVGRFTSVDPLFSRTGNGQQWNRYSYALNNPVLYIDPEGLMAAPIGYSGGMCRSSWEYRIEFGSLCDVWLSFDGDGSGSGAGYIPVPQDSLDGPNRIPDQPTPKPTPAPAPTPAPGPPPEGPAPIPEEGCKPGAVLYAAVAGTFAPLLGVDVSFGVYREQGTGEWGLFWSRGVAVGVSYGGGVQGGYAESKGAFDGESINLGVGFGPIGVNGSKDGGNTEFTGGALGYGGSLPYMKLGASVSRTRTTLRKVGGGCK